jgi:hypothetical protein
MEPVNLQQIRGLAVRVAIRLALGEFVIRGPRDNVLELESRVAWATVASELGNEGYEMMVPAEYAAILGVCESDIREAVERNGSLFALTYGTKEETFMLVATGRRPHEQLGPVPE